MFLNVTRGMSFKNTKQVIYGRPGLNYNDAEIAITCKCLVEKNQYFSIPIACDVNFKNVRELFVQSETNMIELYVSNWLKLRSSYNIKHGDTIVSIPISAQPIR